MPCYFGIIWKGKSYLGGFMIILIGLFLFLFSINLAINKGSKLDLVIIIGYLYLLCKLIFTSIQNLDVALIIILLFYSISDILWGLRIVGLSIPLVRNILLKYIDFKDFLKYKISVHMRDISEVILLLLLILLIYVQVIFNMPTVSFQNTDTNIIELISFEIGVFSLYGIYVGFLQFLTENDKGYYLGVSKTKFMLDKSIWSRFTRTKLFHILLLLTVVMPVLGNFIHRTYYFEYIWQASSGIVVIIYIYLLKLNISVAYNVFRLNAEGIHKKIQNQDSSSAEMIKKLRKTSVDEEISISLQREMKELFWKVYKKPDEYVDNFVSVFLENRFLLIDVEERNDFVFSIFHKEYWRNYNLAYSIDEYLEKLSSEKISDFYKFYRKYCKYKWEFLKKFQDNILSNTWKELIEQDLRVFQSLEKKDDTFEVLQIEKPTSLYLGQSSDYKIKEYLFETLINNKDIELNVIVDELKNELHSIKNSKEEKELQEQNEDFLRFKLNQLFKLYEKGEREFSLPEFKKLSYESDGRKYNDFYNSMLYSEICFNYLDRGRIETFVQNKITEAESEEEIKQKRRDEKIQNLLLSMNEEYRLAFMLYQLLYTDHTEWDDNVEFYDAEIKKITRCDEERQNYLFNQAKEKILSTNISHRITDKLLDNLWTKRKEKITDFYWFNQFGRRHQMSELKIIYVQWLLSGKEFSFSSRFDFINDSFSISKVTTKVKKSEKSIKVSSNKLHWKRIRNKKKLDNFCREYLLLTDKLDSIFTNDSYSYKQNDIQLSVEYLLSTDKVDLSNVITNLSISSLLRLEWILRFRVHRYNRDFSYTSRTIFDSMTSNSPFYWSGGEGVLEFYILKIIDSYYGDLYSDSHFLDGLKRNLISTLNFHNFTVNEYVELISEKVSTIDSISIFQKEEINCKLNDFLYNTETKNDKSKLDYKKPYRYR
jgi:putative membrane protein